MVVIRCRGRRDIVIVNERDKVGGRVGAKVDKVFFAEIALKRLLVDGAVFILLLLVGAAVLGEVVRAGESFAAEVADIWAFLGVSADVPERC